MTTQQSCEQREFVKGNEAEEVDKGGAEISTVGGKVHMSYWPEQTPYVQTNLVQDDMIQCLAGYQELRNLVAFLKSKDIADDLLKDFMRFP